MSHDVDETLAQLGSLLAHRRVRGEPTDDTVIRAREHPRTRLRRRDLSHWGSRVWGGTGGPECGSCWVCRDGWVQSSNQPDPPVIPGGRPRVRTSVSGQRVRSLRSGRRCGLASGAVSFPSQRSSARCRSARLQCPIPRTISARGRTVRWPWLVDGQAQTWLSIRPPILPDTQEQRPEAG